jgi:site-specific DNA-cytosine methylase
MIKDILETKISEKFYLSEKAVAKIERSKFGREYATIDTDKTRTLIAGYYKIPSDGIYFNDGIKKRRYTPTECEKLQTIPLNYTDCVSDSQRYKMIGNGWTVDVIAHIFSFINL